jgi:eukaryotic-like serine/threonine-protein kinase
MQNTPPIEPPDDEVSITDLDTNNDADNDTNDKKRGQLASFRQRSLQLFLQAKRRILTIAIVGAATLFLAVVFLPLLPKPTIPQPKVRPVAPETQANAVETSYLSDKIIYINTLDGSVNALQANSGKALWHYLPTSPASRPLTIVQNMVYFTTQNNQKSMAYALDAGDGELAWQRQLPDTHLSLISVTATTLYFQGLHGEIYTLNAKNGDFLWQYKEKNSSSHSWLAVLNGIVYLTNLDRMTISALQANTGRFLWSKQGSGAIWILETTRTIAYIQLSNTTFDAIKTSDGSTLWRFTGVEQGDSFTLQQNIIYLTTHTGTVVALKASDGTLLWQFKEMYPIWGSLVATPQTIYLNALDGNIYALNASDGRLLWRQKINDPLASFAPPISGQVYTNSTEQIYVATNNGITYAFRANTGEQLWQYRAGLILPARRDEAAAVIEPAVYIILHDNTFVALRLRDGAIIWSYKKAVQEPPFLERGILYISTQDGLMQALRADTGSSLWQVAIAHQAPPAR